MAEGDHWRARRGREGIAPIVLGVVLIIVVVVGGVGIYVATKGPSSPKANTMILASSTSSSRSTPSGPHSSVSSSGSGFKTYSGTFNYSVPLGPSGERVFSNGTVQSYTSVYVGSGTFTFFINPQNYSGSGSGQGTITVTTTGFCSGSVTLKYTFRISDATTILGGNTTLFFALPTPSSAKVPLTCTGPMAGVDTSTNNPITFEAIYSGEITSASIPVTVSQHLTGNIDYGYNIVRTN